MGALYVDLAQDFKWTLDQIGDLTLQDVDFITLGWSQRPPLAFMVGAALGLKRDQPAKPDEGRAWTEEEIRSFVAAANAGGA